MTATFTPTPRQLHLLRFIAGHIEARGHAPTVQECAAALGERAKGNAHRLLDGLEERGLIRRPPNHRGNRAPRQIEVLHPVPIPRAPDGAPLHFIPFAKVENRP